MEPKMAGRLSEQMLAMAHSVADLPSFSQGGIAAGTLIYTLDGEMPVEHLTPGDRVITRDRGAVGLGALAIAQRRISRICVVAGSLGHNRPESDTWVAADQPLLIRDWRAQSLRGTKNALIPADQLLDDRYLSREPEALHRFYQLVFDAPHIIYAGGLELSALSHAEIDSCKAA